MFDNITIALPMAREGKVRALGVTSARRWDSVPEIPSIAETVPGLEALLWYGIVAPRRTPSDVVLSLNKAVTEAFNDADFLARLAETGGAPVIHTSAEFREIHLYETD